MVRPWALVSALEVISIRSSRATAACLSVAEQWERTSTLKSAFLQNSRDLLGLRLSVSLPLPVVYAILRRHQRHSAPVGVGPALHPLPSLGVVRLVSPSTSARRELLAHPRLVRSTSVVASATARSAQHLLLGLSGAPTPLLRPVPIIAAAASVRTLPRDLGVDLHRRFLDAARLRRLFGVARLLHLP